MPKTSSSSFLSSWKQTPGLYTHHTYVDFRSITNKFRTDQTDQLFLQSVSGNNYLLVLFDLDRNYIFAEPKPNHTKHSIKNASANSRKIIKNRGLKSQLNRLDNETSDTVFKNMTIKHIDYQLTLAGLNELNCSEREIHTSKNSFIAGLCSTDPNFTLNIWWKLVTNLS